MVEFENLIIDKYYCIKCINSDIIYFRLLSISDYSSYINIHPYDYIIKNYHYEYCLGFNYTKSDIIEEVDLSFIVKYLPKNHPDRILFRKQRLQRLLYER